MVKKLLETIRKYQTTDDGVPEDVLMKELKLSWEDLRPLLRKTRKQGLIAKRKYLKKRQWYLTQPTSQSMIRRIQKALRRGITIYFEHREYGTLQVFRLDKLTRWVTAGKSRRKSLCRSFVTTPNDIDDMYQQAMRFKTVTNFREGISTITKASRPKKVKIETKEEIRERKLKEKQKQRRLRLRLLRKERKVVRIMYKMFRRLYREDRRTSRRSDRKIVREMFRLFKEVSHGQKVSRKQEKFKAKVSRKEKARKRASAKKEKVKRGKKSKNHKAKEKGNPKVHGNKKGHGHIPRNRMDNEKQAKD